MSKLFVDKTIAIQAPPSKVWMALTDPALTSVWVREFGIDDGSIVSEWTMGSPVLWKTPDGQVAVEGTVTALQLKKFLRFTVFDTRSEKPPVTEEDGITYKLTEQNGKTTLWVSQGDFSSMKEGEKYRDLSAEIWDRVLAKVKRLAEK